MLTPDQADPFLKKITNPTIDRRYKAVIAKVTPSYHIIMNE